jgi:NAD(P)-dependent dehydrogenase (short-subunit alcohol dehydrogenase family)
MTNSRPNGKIAFITGGNRGLGLQTARELGRQEITVVLGVRDLSKAQPAVKALRDEGINPETIRLDVADATTYREAFEFFEGGYGRLDILVNNAGVWLEDPPPKVAQPGGNRTSTLPEEILRKTFETNFFGTVALTQQLLPLLRKSAAGRIVNVSSIQGSLTLQSDSSSPIYPYKAFAYDTAKTALNSFTIHLAHELKDTPIKVNSAHPGWVKTDMGGADASLEISEGGKTSAWLATLPADGPTGGFFHIQERVPW